MKGTKVGCEDFAYGVLLGEGAYARVRTYVYFTRYCRVARRAKQTQCTTTPHYIIHPFSSTPSIPPSSLQVVHARKIDHLNGKMGKSDFAIKILDKRLIKKEKKVSDRDDA